MIQYVCHFFLNDPATPEISTLPLPAALPISPRDSVGSDVVFGPRQLALMTAGHGIAHSEQSPVTHPRYLHGAQLWVALPDASREVAPHFQHHATLPGFTSDGLTTTVLMGSVGGATSPGTAYSPLVGADLQLAPGADEIGR